jgi:hypothetical protein
MFDMSGWPKAVPLDGKVTHCRPLVADAPRASFRVAAFSFLKHLRSLFQN